MKLLPSFARLAALSVVFGLTVSGAWAREDLNRPSVGRNRPGASAPGTANRVNANCLFSSSRAELDINNVRAMVLNGGDMWWDLNIARYEVPKVTDPNQPKRTSIFAGAIWIGGLDAANTLYTAVQTYRQGGTPDVGYWPGPLDDLGQVTPQTCSDFNVHSKVDRTDVDVFRSQSFPMPRDLAASQFETILKWPGSGNPELNWSGINTSPLAPFENNTAIPGNDPLVYEPLLGDYPKIDGDQAIWWVMNDKGAQKVPFTPAIGIELAVEAFAFKTNDLLNSMTFYKQRIANKGGIQLNSTYFGQWVDADLGYFNDDFVGCDIPRGLGLCYNGDDFDEGATGYGLNPPTVGVDFFEGPLADTGDGVDNNRDNVVDEAGEKIIMSNFVYYNNSGGPLGNPSAATDHYNYLRSRNRNGDPLLFGGDGLVTGGGRADLGQYKFMFPGGGCSESLSDQAVGFTPARNPPYSWSEANNGTTGRNSPGDRRFLQSAGPFTLRPGAVNQITIGVIWAKSGSGGAQGSVRLLCVADDKAQKLFEGNFKNLDGPAPADVKVTELDQQIVLAIQAGQLNGQTTETYSETLGSTTYKFEGYLVYQLANDNASPADVGNPDLARLVARGDVINGVTRIVNREFQADIDDFVPVQKVNGENADKGVFHTLSITEDKFASGNPRLVNFHQYYYVVVPYSYSADPGNPEPYLASAKAEKFIVIPHKTAPEQNGTVLASTFGSKLAMQRVFGQGTGGAVIEVTPESEAVMVRNDAATPALLTYTPGHTPVQVQVYDPKLVKAGKFRVKLSSRLVYQSNSIRGNRVPQVGDTLHSIGQYARSESATSFTSQGNGRTYNPNIISTSCPQRKGFAIVRRIASSVPQNGGALITLDIQMLNDDIGGTFMADVDRYFNANVKTGVDANGNATYSTDVPSGYIQESRDFEILNTTGGPNGTTIRATAQEYTRSDFWALYDDAGALLKLGERTVSEFNEQLVPEYGLSIQVRHALNPGSERATQASLQFREASLTHTGIAWLTGVPYERATTPRDTTFVDPVTGVITRVGGPGFPKVKTSFGMPWLLSEISNDKSGLLDIDPTPTYNKVLPVLRNGIQYGGTLAPYGETSAVDQALGGDIEAGASYTRVSDRSLCNLHNIDIVFTSDKSKWTRVTVLQISPDSGRAALTGTRLTKILSRTPSLAVTGEPSGEKSKVRPDSLSRGMGWFPGYAIDLDLGIRLNMAFSEDQAFTRLRDPNQKSIGQGRVVGKNLKWDPTYSRNGGRNFVYVLGTRYDEGRRMERYQDSIAWTLTTPRRINATTALYDSVMMWVYNPRLIAGRRAFQDNSAARVRVRVDRYFTSYPGDRRATRNTNPEYSFELDGQLAVATNQRDAACKAITDLVRVVPNPYYAFSGYERGQLENRVLVTNVTRRIEVDIYTLNGTLVRRLRKDNGDTFLDWNLRNDKGLPIASGVYLFHVKDPVSGCETVVKWFGVLRPVDLESF